jgi:hypothetical protein
LPNQASQALIERLRAEVDRFVATRPEMQARARTISLLKAADDREITPEMVMTSGVYMDHVPLMEAALAEGADLNAVALGNTFNPAQLSARQGSQNAFGFLGERGALLKGSDFEALQPQTVEYAPAVIAAFHGRAGILEMMATRFGVNLSLEHSADDTRDQAPLVFMAALSVDAPPARKIETLDTLDRLGLSFKEKDGCGTPLLTHMFHEWGILPNPQDLEVLKHLVVKKPELVQEKDLLGRTVIDVVRREGSENGRQFLGAIMEAMAQVGARHIGLVAKPGDDWLGAVKDNTGPEREGR